MRKKTENKESINYNNYSSHTGLTLKQTNTGFLLHGPLIFLVTTDKVLLLHICISHITEILLTAFPLEQMNYKVINYKTL